MQENQLFEYAIIRVVPKVEREEFLNVGVILYCKDLKFLDMRYMIDESRLHHFCKDLDLQELKEHLVAYENICKGNLNGGPIAKLDLPSRFRWLTATRSTIVQSSKVHPGLCKEPAKTLEHLFERLVLVE
ncbi:MAG: DUF3037 domain-containing protein [Chitinophagaceae bacterium]|jgi:hypothetical protein|nr:DUF3037 domain-containing protein [Chitinophagaceae bacterium]